MEKNLQDTTSILEQFCNLFEEADYRIEIEENKDQDLEFVLAVIKKNTEKYAQTIFSLVTNILNAVNCKNGTISSLIKSRNLDTKKIGLRTIEDIESSYYCLNDQEFTISFSSNEYRFNFLQNKEIDWTYLESILSPLGIEINSKYPIKQKGGLTGEIITVIKLKRPQKIKKITNL